MSDDYWEDYFREQTITVHEEEFESEVLLFGADGEPLLVTVKNEIGFRPPEKKRVRRRSKRTH